MRMASSKILSTATVALTAALLAGGVAFADDVAAKPQSGPTPQSIIEQTIANENAAAARHDHFEYLTYERSDRTGGRLWQERVIETDYGRLRLLLAEDGRPISAQRHQQEIARLNAIAANPAAFERGQSTVLTEEKRARDMLAALPHFFLFDNITLQNGIWRMEFRPDPAATPSGLEERVLHEMAGLLVIDAHDLRLIHMDFHLTQDVSLGYGLLANVHAGSNFVSDREFVDGGWHTLHIATQVHAKAMLFKTLNMNLDLARTDFVPLDRNLTIQQAVALLEK
jgi:hypothetical protein